MLVLGRPGSGKGTVCSKLHEEFGYRHISVGGLLREQMNNPENEDREILKKHMLQGKVAPVEITCKLLENEIIQQAKKCMPSESSVPISKFLIDGFPLNLSNQSGFQKTLGKKINLESVIYLNCSENTCVTRIIDRSTNSGRYDDTMSRIGSRHVVYMKEAMPVVEYYKSFLNFHEIDAEQELDKVYQDVRQLFL